MAGGVLRGGKGTRGGGDRRAGADMGPGGQAWLIVGTLLGGLATAAPGPVGVLERHTQAEGTEGEGEDSTGWQGGVEAPWAAGW